MARTEISLTGDWQKLADGPCFVTVQSAQPGRVISLNESASSVAALNTTAEPGGQYAQNESKPTYGKGVGVVVIVDTAG